MSLCVCVCVCVCVCARACVHGRDGCRAAQENRRTEEENLGWCHHIQSSSPSQSQFYLGIVMAGTKISDKTNKNTVRT